MRFFPIFSALLLSVVSLAAQNADPLSYTLPTGKVLHFESAEQKAKFLAARQRQSQVPAPTLEPVPKSAPDAGLPFITLDAVRGSSSAQFAYNWLSDWGSYDLATQQSVNVDITVRNMSRAKVAIKVRTLFFSRSITGNHSSSLFLLSDKSMDLDAGQKISFPMASGAVASRDQNYTLINTRLVEGERYEGWVVQILTSDERLVRQTGSSSHLEEWAKSDDFRLRVLPAWKKSHEEDQSVEPVQ